MLITCVFRRVHHESVFRISPCDRAYLKAACMSIHEKVHQVEVPTLKNMFQTICSRTYCSRPKRRKRVVLKIIRQKTGSAENSDSDDGQIPAPPPGSPPLLHTQQLIEMFSHKQPLTASSNLVAVS